MPRHSPREHGVSAVEFTLLFPLLLCVLLLILQVALVVQAKFVVNYAAYCAARSAITILPARVQSARTGQIEARNQWHASDVQSPKHTLIHRAAALPLTAISPLWSPAVAQVTGATSYGAIGAQLTQVAAFFPATEDAPEYAHQFGLRAPYAFNPNNTRVEIRTEAASATNRFSDHDLITARVTHRYYLAVPFANRLLGTSFSGSWLNASAWYLEITEQYTLVNEGEPTFPPAQVPPGSEIYVED